jgi:hypothetical protein
MARQHVNCDNGWKDQEYTATRILGRRTPPHHLDVLKGYPFCLKKRVHVHVHIFKHEWSCIKLRALAQKWSASISTFDIQTKQETAEHHIYTMKVTAAAALFAGLAAAGPVEIAERQSCPKVYIFGARETTLPQSNGYGTAAGLVNSVKSAYPGAGSEAIVYPACGGGSACGGISYDNSASQGTAAVVKAVTAYNQKCPSTQIVLIGYSQVSDITG